MLFIQYISISTTIAFLFIVFRLVAKKQLREEFSIIWVIAAVCLNIVAFWRDSIEVLAGFFGVYYPPSVLYIGLFLLIIIYCLHLSVLISRQRTQIKNLTQEIALLNERLEKVEKNKFQQ
jgi:hypothetical protein